MRDYQLVSPSLEGVLTHSSVQYEGIARPVEVLRVMDGPASKGRLDKCSPEEQAVLGQYFHDLYEVFLKKLASFASDPEQQPTETLKLQAMLQEMIKIKKLLGK